MSGLNLVGALRGYQEGVQWKRDNDEFQDTQAANAAGAAAAQAAHQAALDQQRSQWVANGNTPDTFKPASDTPGEEAIVAGLNARGDAFAAKGRWSDFAKNEAQAAPLRQRIRQRVIGQALADYDASGDAMALAHAAYPTFHNGVDIVGGGQDTTVGQGNNPSAYDPTAAQAAQAAGGAYTLHLSDGRTVNLTGDKIRGMAVDALASPEDIAHQEFAARLSKAQMAQKLAQAIAEAKAKGEETRQTEGLKHTNKVGEISLTTEGNLKVAGERTKGLVTSAGIRAGATTTAATTAAEARKEAARVAAEGRITAAKTRSAATGVDKRMTQGELANQAKTTFGPQVNGLMGGSRIGNMDTAAIAALAHKYRTDNPSMSDMDALLAAGAKYGFKTTKKPAGLVNSAGAAAPAASVSTSGWNAPVTAAQRAAVASTPGGSTEADDGTDDEEN